MAAGSTPCANRVAEGQVAEGKTIEYKKQRKALTERRGAGSGNGYTYKAGTGKGDKHFNA